MFDTVITLCCADGLVTATRFAGLAEVGTAQIPLYGPEGPARLAAQLRNEPADAVICPGGALKPLRRGVYALTEAMAETMDKGLYGLHEYNALSRLCLGLAGELHGAALLCDPLSCDELSPLNRISSLSGVPKRSRYHACETAALLETAARAGGARPEELNAIVFYADDRVSVGGFLRGVCVEVNDMVGGEGPMGFRSAGDVPVAALVKHYFASGKTTAQLTEELTCSAGILGYTGVDSPEQLDALCAAGRADADTAAEALAQQLAKWAGMCALALGRTDLLVLGGKAARSRVCAEKLAARVGAIAPLRVLPETGLPAYLHRAARRAGSWASPILEY